jgi:hypothetical protein
MSREASCGIYITALKACTKQLSDCISRRNGPPIAKGTVRNLSSIPKATKEINEKKKCDGMSGVQDMQINAIEELSRDDLIKAMDKFYSHDGSLKLCPLMIFNTHVEFLLGISMLSRGEDTRFFTFGVMFTAMLVNIGFGVFSVLCYISSCGKTNDSGHYTKTGVAPHKIQSCVRLHRKDFSFCTDSISSRIPHPIFWISIHCIQRHFSDHLQIV